MQRPGCVFPTFLNLIGIVTIIIVAGAVGGVSGYYTAYTTFPTPVTEESLIIDAIHKVNSAVVTIVNQMLPSSGVAGTLLYPIVSGSGVIVDPRGLIVTNTHVVNRGQTIQVIFSDGTKTTATMIGEDSISDIAVIRVTEPVPGIAAWGDSSRLELGQMVIAIGSPLDEFHGTVTLGVVSGLDRQVGGMRGLIQTDAAINKGSSGGPLINRKGEVVGINTLTVRSANDSGVLEGLGFAIPSNRVREIVDQLISTGSLKSP